MGVDILSMAWDLLQMRVTTAMLSIFLLSLLFLIGCATLNNADRHGTSSWRHSAVFLDSARIENLKNRIVLKTEPNFSAWLKVKKNCDDGLTQVPSPVERWAIPGFYDGHEEHERAVVGLHRDSTLAYEEALCFRISNDRKYSKQSVRILKAWANTLKEADASLDDTKLSMNEFFSPMIVAADLLESSNEWSRAEKIHFKKFVREIILPLNTMKPKKNNHANWGVLLVLCAAAYADNLALFEEAEVRFKELMELQIGTDGTMLYEYDRSDNKNWHGGPTKGKNGIWYSNYALLPMTLGAEVLRLNGRDVFEYRTPSGKSMQMAYEKISHWSFHPEDFPFYKSNNGQLKGANAVSYFELLNLRWPTPDAAALLKKLRPITSVAGIPDLTLTHGNF